MEKAEKEYRALVDHLNVGVVVHNADTTIRHCNQSAAMLLGLEMAKIELFDDGSAVFRVDDTLEKGNWRVQNNGKELVVQLKDGDQVSRIQRIARDTIFLDPVSAQGPQFTRVLVPAQ